MNNFPKSEPLQGGWGKAKILDEDEDKDEDEERGRIHAGRFSASRRAISANVAAKTTIVNSSTVLIFILIFIFILSLFKILRFRILFTACQCPAGAVEFGAWSHCPSSDVKAYPAESSWGNMVIPTTDGSGNNRTGSLLHRWYLARTQHSCHLSRPPTRGPSRSAGFTMLNNVGSSSSVTIALRGHDFLPVHWPSC